MHHLSYDELQAGLPEIRRSPRDEGRLELIALRPAVDQREVVEEGRLDVVHGLVGDTWAERGSRKTPDGRAEPDRQLTLMNSRAVHLLAGERSRWALAGDQLYVDLDLSDANLPTGTRLRIGSAVVEVTAAPHTGCAKFAARYGADARRFVNSDAGNELRLRGINARVVETGTVRVGDTIRRVV
ncbi:MAG: hypothetical protein MUF83_16515 [Acidimicrobiales bacterium]|nr:hypothetical protein [Acidimicrobiales bacterium]